MNDFLNYFRKNDARLIHKCEDNLYVYDRHFSKYKDKPVNIVEIGVSHGGSLQMHKNYFGKQCKIIGVDINPKCKALEENQIEIMIGDQSDRKFLKSILEKMPHIDIVIDDGGHKPSQQIPTFEELFPHITEHGVYLCEDLGTNYWKDYEGGYKKPTTFIEYSKNFIDYLNAWWSKEREKLDVNQFTRSVDSVHYYDSIIVIEKRPEKTKASVGCKTGKYSF